MTMCRPDTAWGCGQMGGWRAREGEAGLVHPQRTKNQINQTKQTNETLSHTQTDYFNDKLYLENYMLSFINYKSLKNKVLYSPFF
jgi:hypothetical protein